MFGIRRWFAAAAAWVAWFALAFLFKVIVSDPAPPPAAVAIVNYFSFFTVLSNILAALAFTSTALFPNARFFNRPGVRAAIAVYIAMVAAVYHLILNDYWRPTGMLLIAYILLHYATPALYWIDWVLFAPKRGLTFYMTFSWLIFPALCGAEIMLRGSIDGYYSYPFLDAARLGYTHVLLNFAVMVGVFELAGCAVVAIARILPPRPA